MLVSRRRALSLAASLPLMGLVERAYADPPSIDASSAMPLVQSTYRYLHENPELGLQERLAHDHILSALQRLGGFTFHQIPGTYHQATGLPTAIVAQLDTGRPGPCRALRAELDARRLNDEDEPVNHDPRSTIPRRMHSCGHDAHAAMLLGAASYIRANQNNFTGRLVFIFQPAEEIAGGADDIVNSGLLTTLGVEAIFAQHCAPGLPVGSATVSRGATMAGSTTFELTITGRSSHAAVPFEGDDVAVVAAHFIDALATFPARHLDIANRPVVISPTELTTNASATNVLPTEASIRGTIRAFERLDQAPAGATPIATLLLAHLNDLARAYGVTVALRLTPGAPPNVNDDTLFDRAVVALGPTFRGNLSTPNYRGMFAEDFAFYTSAVRSLYFNLGIAKDGLGSGAIHTSAFTIHPDALEVGVRLLIAIARDVPLT